jgi:hypothetical protein
VQRGLLAALKAPVDMNGTEERLTPQRPQWPLADLYPKDRDHAHAHSNRKLFSYCIVMEISRDINCVVPISVSTWSSLSSADGAARSLTVVHFARITAPWRDSLTPSQQHGAMSAGLVAVSARIRAAAVVEDGAAEQEYLRRAFRPEVLGLGAVAADGGLEALPYEYKYVSCWIFVSVFVSFHSDVLFPSLQCYRVYNRLVSRCSEHDAAEIDTRFRSRQRYDPASVTSKLSA